ncbi:MAG TPA: hypothetical protein VMU04_08095 [Candidatus Acidoferrum sp.]|nr:hypothetical protein [Candidatus Acidoferrum sp.]
MKKWIKILLLVLAGLAIAVFLLVWLVPPPQPVNRRQPKAAYTRAAQRLYRHEILSLYQPPEEAFTSHGLRLVRRIQALYSPFFLPYLVTGSVPVQPDVLYNPWFNLFLLIEDSDGDINSVVLASSLAAGQTPQLQVHEKFWQELYRRYAVAQMATFSTPIPFENTGRAMLEMRNLTNRFGWPPRVRMGTGQATFDLYIQRPAQAIYCTPTEPGTYLVFSYHDGRLHTNVMALPPYHVKEVERRVAETIKNGPGQAAANLH